MKYFSTIISLCFFLFLSFHAEAQTETFKVYGNCGMCKDRIEKAVTGLKGVQSADWDEDTKMITVSFDKDVISLDAIQKKIAEIGHDTDKFRAKDDVYENLHSCCHYDRPKKS
ncbi:MAG: heavy-metal-associated domain-containing protein [Saprospirales bacterium]|nr:heavy-metal-associated domain-containing protein [Saprospirales bacterium]MBK8492014.1 heavy-metal-associated domain-containing protein [Saprospirales bacterium]